MQTYLALLLITVRAAWVWYTRRVSGDDFERVSAGKSSDDEEEI